MTPNSTRPIAVLFLFAFLTSASYVLTSALGVSWYLGRVGASALPVVLAASAVAVVFVSSLTYAAISSVRTRRCLVICWSLMLVVSIILSLRLQTSGHSVYLLGLLYVLGEIRGCLNTVFLTTLATDQFNNSSSKRPYAMVAAGAPSAGIVVGLMMGYDPSHFSDVRFIQVIAGLDAAVLLLALFLPRSHTSTDNRAAPANANSASDEKDSGPVIEQSDVYRFRFSLAMLLVMETAVLTLIGFQWKYAVSEYLHENETAMIAYFAMYYAATDILILSFQLAVAGRMLDRFGIGVALVGYPLLLACTGAVALFTQLIWSWFVLMTLTRGLDVVRRSLHDPSLSAAFALFHAKTRRKVIVFVKGVCKPTAEVITSILLLLYADGLGFQRFTIYWWCLLIPWIIAAWTVSRIYRSYHPSLGNASDEKCRNFNHNNTAAQEYREQEHHEQSKQLGQRPHLNDSQR
ncbi:MFS transporter [Neorhodopirellula lusitana]|uniref:MFS transporter n=1 Tax=Neorhodopirellula lusitana TaxID=445327 RepID=UPI00384E8EE3